MHNHTLFTTLLCSTALVASSAAVAQTANMQTTPSQTESESGGLVQHDIIVTATRDTRRLQDVPMSVNVATGEQLQKLSLFDVKDIQQLAPSLELTNTTGRNSTTTLRGIAFDPDSAPSPTVQTYVNEVPANAQTVFTALYDIGQIEILRGPQGLNRGLSSPAGAITITTRRPVFDKVTGYAQATGTDRSAFNVQGGVTLPFSDKFAIRVAALADGNRVNQVRDVTNGDRSFSHTLSGRITAGFRPTEDFTAFLTYQYLQSDSRQYPQVIGTGAASSGVPTGPGTIEPGDYLAVQDGGARFENRSHQVTLNTEWDLGRVTVNGLAAYQYTNLRQARDMDPTNAIPGYAPIQRIISPYKVPTFEFRVSTNDNGSLGGGLGVFYTKTNSTTLVNQRADNFFFVSPAPYVFLPVGVDIVVPIKADTWSFNANGHARVGNLRVEGGIRYSIYRYNSLSTVSITSPGLAAFGVAPFSTTQEGVPPSLRHRRTAGLTGGLTATYEVTPDLNLYGSYSHSFRQGGIGISVPLGVSDDLLVTNNEKTDAYEIGVKGSFLNRRLNVSVAAFYQKFDGFLNRFTGIYYNCPNFSTAFGGGCGPVPPAAPINTPGEKLIDGSFDFNYNGDATVKGIEATIDGRPTDFWDISVSMAYVKARYDKNARLPCNDFNGDGRPDGVGTPAITGTANVSFCNLSRLSDTPDFTLSANTELRLPTVGSINPFVRGLINYRPEVFSMQRNYTFQSRTVINLYAGVRTDDGTWELTGFVKNLLDQRRITDRAIATGSTTTGFGVFESGYRGVNVMAPREFGATLAMHW